MTRRHANTRKTPLIQYVIACSDAARFCIIAQRFANRTGTRTGTRFFIQNMFYPGEILDSTFPVRLLGKLNFGAQPAITIELPAGHDLLR